MDSPRSNLLQAAKAFIAKSTKAAAVIAPLAMAAVPTEAEAQVVFGPLTSTSASAFVPSGAGVYGLLASSSFTKSLSVQGGFTGQQFGANYTITNLPGTPSDLEAVIEFSSSSGSSGVLTEGTTVPFAYQFSLSFSSGITPQYLLVNATLSDADGRIAGSTLAETPDFSSGSFFGSGSFIIDDGNNDSEAPINLSGGSWSVELRLGFGANSTSDSIMLSMGPSDGFALGSTTLSAVPEPSTYALLFGLTAIAYAAYRRRRAA